MAAGGNDVKVRTLSGQDPDLAARHAAYLARKNQKKDRQKADAGNFLSNVQEIDADVAYRFNFTIVGPGALSVVKSVCSSGSAAKLSGCGRVAPQNGSYRCLCEVSPPPGTAPALAGLAGKRIAKLALSASSFEQGVAPCETRQEALNSAIVYALPIDEKAENGESNFGEHLDALYRALKRLRSQTRARLRPVKAVLLYCSLPENVEPRSTLDSWAVQLADFEQMNGDMWKFGPVYLSDGNVLHSTFAEMTSARIVHAQSGVRAGEDDPAAESGRPAGPGEDPLLELDGAPPDSPGGGFTPSAGRCRISSGASETGSSCSEQERPPRFEAEMSGSECSESALELHQRAFGLEYDSGSAPPTPRGDASARASTEAYSPTASAAGAGEGTGEGAAGASASKAEPKEAPPEDTKPIEKAKAKEHAINDASRLAAEEHVKAPSLDVGVDQPTGKGLCCIFC